RESCVGPAARARRRRGAGARRGGHRVREPRGRVEMTPLPTGAAKTALVRQMFERIAPRYDRVNRVLSLGLDRRWRRAALAAVGVGAGDRVVDLACGTGDLAELAAGRGARVVGVDGAREMLRGARRRHVAAGLVR